MESGAPESLMLSTLLHVAAVRCLQCSKVISSIKEMSAELLIIIIIIMSNNCLDSVADTLSSCVFCTRRYFFTMPILFYVKGDENGFKSIFLFY